MNLACLVAELAFDPKPQRRAMADRQGAVVHAVGEDGLRMEGVDQVDALVVGRAAEIVGAVQDDVARVRLQAPWSSTALSGTPVHLPMALQPSTQSWRVICVREGMARRSASESDWGASTRPSTASR